MQTHWGGKRFESRWHYGLYWLKEAIFLSLSNSSSGDQNRERPPASKLLQTHHSLSSHSGGNRLDLDGITDSSGFGNWFLSISPKEIMRLYFKIGHDWLPSPSYTLEIPKHSNLIRHYTTHSVETSPLNKVRMNQYHLSSDITVEWLCYFTALYSSRGPNKVGREAGLPACMVKVKTAQPTEFW